MKIDKRRLRLYVIVIVAAITVGSLIGFAVKGESSINLDSINIDVLDSTKQQNSEKVTNLIEAKNSEKEINENMEKEPNEQEYMDQEPNEQEPKEESKEIVKELILYDFKGNGLGALEVKSLIKTPIENSTTGFALTFNLDVLNQYVSVLVLDSEGQLVSEYPVRMDRIDVIDSLGSHAINVYKSEISGLKEGVTYYYVIKQEDRYSYRYMIESISDSQPTIMAFFGDTQGYKNSQYEAFRKTYDNASEEVKATGDRIDLTYIAGDIVDNGDNYDQWQFFYHNIKGLFEETTFISSIGNHDAHNGGVIYKNAFNYPKNGIPELEERSFYIDLPFARVAVFDTESPSMYDEQSQWLKEIMNESDKAFRIVLMHRSAYPMAYDEAFVRNLASVFEEADIDLVLSGHDHIYSRTTMMENELVSINHGVTYIVGGSSSGSKYYEQSDEENRYWKNIIYDQNNPVFILLKMTEDMIEIEAMSIVNDIRTSIDSFKLYN